MSLFNEPPTLTDSYLLRLFNLSKESVKSISINHKSDGVYAFITLNTTPHTCPVCGDVTSTIKDYTTKTIIHSLITHIPCFIVYKARRYKCNSCHKSFYETNPFVHNNMKISALTVSNVLRDLKLPNETFTSIAKRYHISNTTVAHIFDHHVSVSRRLLPRVLSIDEVFAFHDNKSNYVCVFVDGLTKKTIDILPSRKKDDLIKYFDFIPLEERRKVEIVSIDLWDTYRMVAYSVFPNCRVAVDRFHLVQEINRRVDKIRITTMNKLKPKKDKKKKDMSIAERYEYDELDKNYYLLKKFNWLFYINSNKLYEKNETGKIVNKLDPNYEKKYNHKLNRYLNYYDIEQLLLKINPELTTAIDMLIKFNEFYESTNYDNARENLDYLIYEFSNCEVEEIQAYSKTLKRWKKEIINSFIVIGSKEQFNPKTGKKERKDVRPNNGIAENRNRVIKQLKCNSNGYKNWSRFRNRALYVLNDDVTYTLNPEKKEGD